MRSTTVVLAATVAAALLAGAAATPSAGTLSLAVDAKTGGYTVSVGSTVWLQSAATTLRANGKDYSSADGSLKLGTSSTYSGSDATGAYDATELQWMADATPFVTTFRAYASHIAFAQSFPKGAMGTSVGDRGAALSGFPSYITNASSSSAPARGFLAFNGDMTGSSPITGMWGKDTLPGGVSGTGPIVVFTEDVSTSLVLSPYANFMSVNHVYNEGILSSGIMGNVSSIPVGYVVESVAVLSSGINTAMDAWGDVLLARYGKTREDQFKDYTLSMLGYSTDNGAYYYYHTEDNKTYEDTLLDVKAYADKENIPYRYILLDSWWYFKDDRQAGGGVMNWTAMPIVFPHNLTWFWEQTGWRVQGHNRFWSPDTNYAQANGGPFPFIIEDKVAVPESQDFWDWLMRESAKWGLVVYEQDWLDDEYDWSWNMGASATLARTWLIQMGRAAAKNDITIQYCMSHVRHILQSVEIPAVSQARASGDYSGQRTDQWNVGTSGILAHAVGIAPSKDNYWSITNEPNFPSRYGPVRDEPYHRLQSVAITLSAGPVAPSDGVGDSDRSLIMRACMDDGTLLAPSRPATEIDSHFVREAFGSDGPNGHVWSTHSMVGGQQYTTVLSVELMDAYSLTPAELGYADSASLVAYETNATTTLVMASSTSPLALAVSDKFTFQLFSVAPVNTAGWTLLGEPGKWIAVSKARFQQVDTVGGSSPSLTATIRGHPGEAVTVQFLGPGASTPTSVTCTVGSSAYVDISVPAKTCTDL